MKECSVDGCHRKMHARGLCHSHYEKDRRGMLGRPADAPRYRFPRTNVGKAQEWPYEVEKFDGVWHRRPTGSTAPWAPVPGFLVAANG